MTVIGSIQDVCEVQQVGPDAGETRALPPLLIEVPHGASRARHFEAIRRRLESPLPEDLLDFFFVNTDVGAFECAERLARLFVEPETDRRLLDLLGDDATRIGELPPRSVLIVRSLIPRTFVDCNRILAPEPDDAEMTAAIPAFIRSRADIRELRALHAAYQEIAASGYGRACGAGGTAIQLHTYAPREVRIDRIDDDIVAVLRRAYAPGRYERWNQRPDVDLISRDRDGRLLAPAGLVRAIAACFARAGIEAAENATYRLHPSTTGHAHSTRYPGRVLCVELSRDRLADPFTPFEEMTIGEGKLAEMAAPLAAGCLRELLRGAA